MEKKSCTRVVQELKDLLGEELANDIIVGFVRASDSDLREIRKSLGAFLEPAVAVAR
ncbi:hypothetical protein [Paenibacillus antri]|uniref:hypothetical protein n=1 Tax=Paenibacillus antri TaxID=2582848 RepID=UPI00130508FB|nr:hypothetical protein [Paenibacillus antri]